MHYLDSKFSMQLICNSHVFYITMSPTSLPISPNVLLYKTQRLFVPKKRFTIRVKPAAMQCKMLVCLYQYITPVINLDCQR